MRVAKNKFTVNNQMYKKLITPTQVGNILRLHVDEIEVSQKVKLIKGDTIIEKDSELISMAQKVCTMEEVRLGYRKMRMKYGDATHIMCPYRINNLRGLYNQNSVDDGEYGASRTLLKYWKEQEVTRVCIYIVRYYGRQKQGPCRFQIIQSLAHQVLD